KDISVQPSADSKINDIAKEQPEHPAHPHSDKFKFADDDCTAQPGHATGHVTHLHLDPKSVAKSKSIAKGEPGHPAHPHSDNFKFADDDGSAQAGHAAWQRQGYLSAAER